jgi:chromosomal replication initiation ATPase DnaA
MPQGTERLPVFRGHIAISLGKELTPLSPVAIGTALGIPPFFRQDSSTLLHSYKAIESRKTSDSQIHQNYVKSLKMLSQVSDGSRKTQKQKTLP